MIAALLLVALAASPTCPAPTRSAAVRSQFVQANPCPKMCRTYAYRPNAEGRVVLQIYESCGACNVDHVCPLSCGGLDAAQNMQWLDKKENLKKGSSCSPCRPELYRPGCP